MKTDDSSKIPETQIHVKDNNLDKINLDYLQSFLQLQDKIFNVYYKFVERTQWLITSIITIIVFSVGVFSIIQWDFQKNTKDELEKEINNRLGKINAPPKLEILNVNGQPLEDSEVIIQRIVIKENKNSSGTLLPFTEVAYYLPVIYKNTGEGEISFIRIKIYSNDFSFDYISSNKKYKREIKTMSYSGQNRAFPLLVQNQTESENITLVEYRDINKKLKNNEIRLPNGKYNLLIEVVYPTEEKIVINFTGVIDKSTQVINLKKN